MNSPHGQTPSADLTEINFDGIVGPSHNYAGLSLGNLAATQNAGKPSFPRKAALQGLAKMRGNMALGLRQGFFLPLPRPNTSWLSALSADDTANAALRAGAWSASSMWAANAATVSPAPDTSDGRCHLSVANLVTMPHRAHEWGDTLAQLQLAFADQAHFAVHGPVPPSFGDEGAANHMRLCDGHESAGLEVFVYGKTAGKFPARQHEEASRIIARRHGLDPKRIVFIEQNAAAIEAGAFHNDVVAVANGHVLFVHQRGFADPQAAYGAILAAMPDVQIIEVPETSVSLGEAISSYLFNAQLVSLPDDDGAEGGGASDAMALIVPTECMEMPKVRAYLEGLQAGNGPIRRVIPVDVKQSMANGGGPACLRLRIVADPAKIDQRFMLNPQKADKIERIIAENWPEEIHISQIGDAGLAQKITQARAALLGALDITELA